MESRRSIVAFGTILPELELSRVDFLSRAGEIEGETFRRALLCGAAVFCSCSIAHGVVSHSASARWLRRRLALRAPARLRPAVVVSAPAARTERAARSQRSRSCRSEEFMAEEIDPLLEKISRSGMSSLTPERTAHSRRGPRENVAPAGEKLKVPAIRRRAFPRSVRPRVESTRSPHLAARWPADAPSLGETVAALSVRRRSSRAICSRSRAFAARACCSSRRFCSGSLIRT